MASQELWSPLAIPVELPRDVRNQDGEIRRIVLHITGRKTYLNAMRYKMPPLDWLANYFCQPKSPFSTFGVDPWGLIYQFASEKERPWSQGWRSFGGRKGLIHKLKTGKLTVPKWWKNEWYWLKDPTQLIDRDETSPNDHSISIEFIQWNKSLKSKSNFKLTTAQYIAGHALVHNIAYRHSLILGRDFTTMLSHDDVNPWERGTSKGGWDVGALRKNPRFCWKCFRSLDFEHTGAKLCPAVIPTPPMPAWARG